MHPDLRAHNSSGQIRGTDDPGWRSVMTHMVIREEGAGRISVLSFKLVFRLFNAQSALV